MSKTFQASKLTEWKGLDRISVIVHGMGNIPEGECMQTGYKFYMQWAFAQK